MPPALRTIGPIHLEDLEPHRFEDLIRQLSYDFRPWLSIEPTGRGGSDDGYDARAWERIDGQVEEDSEEDDETAVPPATRLWLIQCKREKSIPPKKLGDYLSSLPQSKEEPIYGIIFAAACDFSKMARDLFRTRTRELGFSEAYLWGKGEIEDQLFQPKNDHLLFAYCGFSLQVRQRSLKTEVRSRLTMKKRAQKLLQPMRHILVRDASDDRYPYLDQDETRPREQRGRWHVFEDATCKWDGIHFRWRRLPAFFDKDNVHWDLAEKANFATVLHTNDNPWVDERIKAELEASNEEAMEIWQKLDEPERAWYEATLVLPYESVIGIDETGDDILPDAVHIYTTQWIGDSPFREKGSQVLSTIDRWSARYCVLDTTNRVQKFPRRKGG